MFPVCACDVEGDWSYQDHPETGEDTGTTWCTSLRPRGCCECGELVEPGQPYDRFEGWNPEDTCWEIFDTCSVCMSIWDDLGCNGRVIGGLDEALWEACGMNLSGEIDDNDEYWDGQWELTVELEREARGVPVADGQVGE